MKKRNFTTNFDQNHDDFDSKTPKSNNKRENKKTQKENEINLQDEENEESFKKPDAIKLSFTPMKKSISRPAQTNIKKENGAQHNVFTTPGNSSQKMIKNSRQFNLQNSLAR